MHGMGVLNPVFRPIATQTPSPSLFPPRPSFFRGALASEERPNSVEGQSTQDKNV
jgi:hypothetical protein